MAPVGKINRAEDTPVGYARIQGWPLEAGAGVVGAEKGNTRYRYLIAPRSESGE
ncbi:hypothetical protein N9H39_09460 [Gammaproteobacteria bacterium]|nr:hypothetical protein [Gammaproteobacteria bacterium]